LEGTNSEERGESREAALPHGDANSEKFPDTGEEKGEWAVEAVTRSFGKGKVMEKKNRRTVEPCVSRRREEEGGSEGKTEKGS